MEVPFQSTHVLDKESLMSCAHDLEFSYAAKHRTRELSACIMAGILIYTAAPDSEGTLGGLVELGNPASMGRHLQQALENLRVCASDPLCSEHGPSTDGRGIHGACWHACLFAPETSCERGNRYLDRAG